MKSFLFLFGWEVRILVKSSLVRWIWALLLVTQGLALLRGYHWRGGHQAEVTALPSLHREQDEAVARQFSPRGEAGYVAYYSFQPTWRACDAASALAIGQRDALPHVLWIRLLGVEGQIQEGALKNPILQCLGTFDFAWVWCLLAPLLLVVFLHDLATRERERGTWTLVRMQTGSIDVWVLARALARMACFALPLALGLFAAVGVMPGLTWTEALAWSVAPALALGAWFLVGTAVALFFRSTVASLVGALSAWLFLAVLWPAAVNLAASSLHPVSGGLALTLAHRETTHAFWDQPKEETRKRFVREEPEWAGCPEVGEGFTWRWYYAMHRLADRSVQPLVRAYVDGLQARDRLANRLLVVSPSAFALSVLHYRQHTDLYGHLEYQESLRAYHANLRAHFFPLVFRDAEITPSDYAAFPAYRPSDDTPRAWSEVFSHFGTLPAVALQMVAGLGYLIIRLLRSS